MAQNHPVQAFLARVLHGCGVMAQNHPLQTFLARTLHGYVGAFSRTLPGRVQPIKGGQHGQRGAILILATLAAATSLLVAEQLIEHALVVEASDVERSLLQLQAHWARRGVVDHLLSRYRLDAAVLVGDGEKTAALEQYVTDLSGTSGATIDFAYPEISADYRLGLQTLVQKIGDPNDGRLRLHMSLTQVSAIPMLRGVDQERSLHSRSVDMCLGPGSFCPGLGAGQSKVIGWVVE
ncbi:MAG: hypothetical protein HQL63_10665 [Magnetococcales bacterium]|nr:hypothetical protein [Magnetococcales bacterium]MBF0321617.1 hypothetical protein [Magnetococcales bacterium]